MKNPFQKLPVTFEKSYMCRSTTCSCIQEENIRYELRILVSWADNIHGDNNEQVFYIYYEPVFNHYCTKSPKKIGECLGIGLPLEEALSEIYKALKDENISLNLGAV